MTSGTEEPAEAHPLENEAEETSHATAPDGTTVVKKKKKVIRKKRRPARPQVDPATFKPEEAPQTGTIFNIWYNKWSGGDREDKYSSQQAAPSRCNIAKDSGYTKADNNPGSFICLFFARGMCPRGQDCERLHRLPSTFDIYSGNVDCFGRDKHSDYRDDMGGVGSFMRQNRTLYVGRINPTDDVEEIVARHFAEWGNIERTRVLPTRGVAFVTYTTESLAQFAKEAMAHQSLDNGEILNVRWATVDPNPASQKREARKVEEQAAEAIRRAIPESFVREIEGDPEAKRRRLDKSSFGLEGYQAPDEVWLQREKLTSAEDQPDRTLQTSAPQNLIQSGEETDHGNTETIPPSTVGNGLLGASTLAALSGYEPQRTRPAPAANGAKLGIGSSLVAYGSDDDSD